MKLSYYLTVILLFFGIFTFSSCSDDNDGPSADVNISIVGDWQIAESDLNGDGARQGIVVHEDGTVTEWLYILSGEDPYQFGFKTGKMVGKRQSLRDAAPQRCRKLLSSDGSG